MITRGEIKSIIEEEKFRMENVGDEYGFPYYDGYIYCYLTKCIENEEFDQVSKIKSYISNNNLMIDPVKYDLGMIEHQEALERGEKKRDGEKRKEEEIEREASEEERKEKLRKNNDDRKMIGVFHFAGGEFKQELFRKGDEMFPPPYIMTHQASFDPASLSEPFDDYHSVKVKTYKFSLRNLESFFDHKDRTTLFRANYDFIGEE